MSRFPFGIPDGWFAVAYCDEIEPGTVRRLRYFARDLVLFRTETGRAALLDAHCPHLGAHLAEGGDVVGESIRCPLHGRRYSPEGACIEVPYAKSATNSAPVTAWRVAEHNGVLMVWHHGAGAPPTHEVPTLREWGAADWTTEYLRRSWCVSTHPQEVLEHSIDWPHFERVHGMTAPEERSHGFDGVEFHWTVGASPHGPLVDPKRENFLIESRSFGLGVSWLRYHGYHKLLVFTGLTPIDADTTEIRLGVVGKHDGRSSDDTHAALSAYIEDQARAMEDDIRIWESKAYLAEPRLCDDDGPIGELRRWASGLYSIRSDRERS
jgi:3-ketosteroid 9alpha-monooxygenase subunit A